MNTRYGPSDRVRTCGLMVPNHPRYQLRHTRFYYFILYYCTYWLSAFNPRRFPQKHSRGSSLGALAPLLVSSPRSNAFIRHRRRHSSSPNCATPGFIILFYITALIDFLLSVRGASLKNIVAALRLKRSLRSLFLHLGAMPSSATGGGIPPRPTAPHPVLLFYFILLHLLAFCFQSARFPQKHSRGSSSDRGTDSAKAVQIYS